MTKKLLILSLFFFSGFLPLHGWEVSKALTLGYISEDNYMHEIQSKWYQRDWSWEQSLRLGFSKEAIPGRRWTIGIDLRNHDNHEFSPYDRFFSGLRVSYREKKRLGLKAPWWRLQVGAGKEKFFHSSIHDRTLADIQLEFGKRLHPRTSISASLGYDRTYGKNTDVLDLSGISGTLQGQYALDNRWSFNLGLTSRKGDVAVHYWDGYYHYYPEVEMKGIPTYNKKYKVMSKVSGTNMLKWSFGLTLASARHSFWNFGWDTLLVTEGGWSYQDHLAKIQFTLKF